MAATVAYYPLCPRRNQTADAARKKACHRFSDQARSVAPTPGLPIAHISEERVGGLRDFSALYTLASQSGSGECFGTF